MRILQITKKFPWPVKDGEVIGIINLTLGFADLGHQVTVLSLNTKKHYFSLDQLPENINNKAVFETVDIDTEIKPFKAFINLFSTQSYNIKRFYSLDFENKIAQTLNNNQFDFIILEGIYLMQYINCIRKYTNVKVILRPQNVEYIIWQRLADKAKNIFKKKYLNLLAHRMYNFEINNINKADILIPVSQVDEAVFIEKGCKLPHRAIPTGYIFDSLPNSFIGEKNAVSFIGGLDWIPNREGVDWFLNKVWPIIIEKRPNTEFYIAGRNFPDSYMNLNIAGVHTIGEVNSAKDFITQASIFVVPLFAGSGMRVKIIEAMALGRAVVSTSIGAESICYTDNEDILIADTALNFANAILRVLNDTEERNRIGINAQKLVKKNYDNKVICQSIIDFVKPYFK